MIPPQRGGKFLIQADPAEELGMTLRSVEATILGRHNRGDHLVLPPG
jgi:hypothetical protein